MSDLVLSVSRQNESCSSATSAWTEDPPEQAAAWNNRLLHAEACFKQFPYWNEPYRSRWIRPRYLACISAGEPSAYACVLEVRLPGLRIGLILRGPVSLVLNTTVSQSALQALHAWALTEGFDLLRYTHDDGPLLAEIAALNESRRVESFPFLTDGYDELIVDQLEEDERMLASFDREARRKIRRASEAGYQIESSSFPDAIDEVWPLYRASALRKGYSLRRPRIAYKEMVRLAQPHGCARVYKVNLDGRLVETCLVFRDRETAFCVLAAMDAEALRNLPSPSVLMHWRAMRDFFRMGARRYNFSWGGGSLARFKNQFSPRLQTYPPPVTLILRPRVCRVWLDVIMPLLRGAEGSLGRILSWAGR